MFNLNNEFFSIFNSEINLENENSCIFSNISKHQNILFSILENILKINMNIYQLYYQYLDFSKDYNYFSTFFYNIINFFEIFMNKFLKIDENNFIAENNQRLIILILELYSNSLIISKTKNLYFFDDFTINLLNIRGNINNFNKIYFLIKNVKMNFSEKLFEIILDYLKNFLPIDFSYNNLKTKDIREFSKKINLNGKFIINF